MNITAYELAERYVGMVLERAGDKDHPLIQFWLSLCGYGLDAADEIPWCSAFVNGMAWELRLPRSKSAAARSWLTVGRPVPILQAEIGWDVVVLSRGTVPQPDSSVLAAPGHVGFYSGQDSTGFFLLAGNQSNGISVEKFSHARVLGIRRLAV